MKLGDIVYMYWADPDWFDEEVDVGSAVKRGVVVATSVGMRIVEEDVDVRGDGFNVEVHLWDANSATCPFHDSIRAALLAALDKNREYMNDLNRESVWLEKMLASHPLTPSTERTRDELATD